MFNTQYNLFSFFFLFQVMLLSGVLLLLLLCSKKWWCWVGCFLVSVVSLFNSYVFNMIK